VPERGRVRRRLYPVDKRKAGDTRAFSMPMLVSPTYTPACDATGIPMRE
jgi:hypothetical protein